MNSSPAAHTAGNVEGHSSVIRKLKLDRNIHLHKRMRIIENGNFMNKNAQFFPRLLINFK